VAVVAREDRAAGRHRHPSGSGWLLLGLAVVCFVGGTWQLAAGVFSG
jgi:hypothetical protein